MYLYNNDPILLYCAKTCNACQYPAQLCIDVSSTCPMWASSNYCSRFRTVYPNPCRSSCRTCFTWQDNWQTTIFIFYLNKQFAL